MPVARYFAHSENPAGIKHDLVEHLKSVARLAGAVAPDLRVGRGLKLARRAQAWLRAR